MSMIGTRCALLLLSFGLAAHTVGCSGPLHVEFVNASGTVCTVVVGNEVPRTVRPGGTTEFEYGPAVFDGLSIHANEECHSYELPAELARSYDRRFVRPAGFMGRVARMQVDGEGLIQLLTPEEESTALNEDQPTGFPVTPVACDQAGPA